MNFGQEKNDEKNQDGKNNNRESKSEQKQNISINSSEAKERMESMNRSKLHRLMDIIEKNNEEEAIKYLAEERKKNQDLDNDIYR